MCFDIKSQEYLWVCDSLRMDNLDLITFQKFIVKLYCLMNFCLIILMLQKMRAPIATIDNIQIRLNNAEFIKLISTFLLRRVQPSGVARGERDGDGLNLVCDCMPEISFTRYKINIANF